MSLQNSAEEIDHQGEDHGNNRLSPFTAGNLHSTNRASSVRSNRSGVTIVEEKSGASDFNKKGIERTGTVEVNIKASRRDFLKGIFLPGKMCKEFAQNAELKGLDTVHFKYHRDDTPYIVTAHVKSNITVGKHREEKTGRCTIDTGNYQGNFVSKMFALEVLGFEDTDFTPMTSDEQVGGISASGHYVHPIGVLHIDWWLKGSTRTFRGMRFLVVPDYHSDLVIGARSIAKHEILSPPNLSANEGTQTFTLNESSLQVLLLEQQRINADWRLAKRRFEEASNEVPKMPQIEIDNLEKKMKDKQKELQVAKAKVEKYKEEHPESLPKKEQNGVAEKKNSSAKPKSAIRLPFSKRGDKSNTDDQNSEDTKSAEKPKAPKVPKEKRS